MEKADAIEVAAAAAAAVGFVYLLTQCIIEFVRLANAKTALEHEHMLKAKLLEYQAKAKEAERNRDLYGGDNMN